LAAIFAHGKFSIQDAEPGRFGGGDPVPILFAIIPALGKIAA
jgi:hypothetical protein